MDLETFQFSFGNWLTGPGSGKKKTHSIGLLGALKGGNQGTWPKNLGPPGERPLLTAGVGTLALLNPRGFWGPRKENLWGPPPRGAGVVKTWGLKGPVWGGPHFPWKRAYPRGGVFLPPRWGVAAPFWAPLGEGAGGVFVGPVFPGKSPGKFSRANIRGAGVIWGAPGAP